MTSNISHSSFLTENGREFPMFCRTKNDVNMKHIGFWFDINPFEYVIPVVLTQVFLVFLVSQSLYYILRPLKQPKFLCNVLGGIILGPSGLGRNETYRNLIFGYKPLLVMNTCAMMGAIYSIFLVSVKMDISMIVRAAKSAWKIGVVGFLSSFVVMFIFLLAFLSSFPGFVKAHLFFLFFPVYSSFTNFPVIAQALDDLNLISSELGQLALSAAMLNDTMQWCVITLGVVFRQNTARQSIVALLSYMVLLLLSFYVLRPIILWVKKRTPEGKPVNETYTMMILLGALVMAALFDSVGIAFIHGPLVLGLIIPDGPPIGTTVVEKAEAILSHFFLPLFFVYVGFNTDLSRLEFSREFVKFESVLLLGHIAKLVGTYLISLSCRISHRNSILLGLIMNIEGIIELIANARWKSQTLIDDRYYTQIVLTAVIVTGIVTPLIGKLYKPHTLLRSNSSVAYSRRNRTIQTNYRSPQFRILACVHNSESVSTFIMLLEALNPNPSSSIFASVVHLVELKGRATPLVLLYKKGSLLNHSHTSNTRHIARAFENYVKTSRGPVMVQTYVNIAHYKSMHETVFSLARDMHVPFIILPFHNNDLHVQGDRITAAISSFNQSIQHDAPCTVGILVDRGFIRHMSVGQFSLNVAVIFLGGYDDREVLALAMRMSENVDVSVTLLWITMPNWQPEGEESGRDKQLQEIEKMMDESMVDEFKMKNMGNACVICHDVVVNDSLEGFKAIRSLEEKEYDLYMVGKRHGGAAFVDEKTATSFAEVRGLGMVGDMLASKDYRNGTATVLVIQQYNDRDVHKNRHNMKDGHDYEKGIDV